MPKFCLAVIEEREVVGYLEKILTIRIQLFTDIFALYIFIIVIYDFIPPTIFLA
jgi:hypothetical protein